MRRAVLGLLVIVVALPLTFAPGEQPVQAALGGLTKFNIDGNTAGPNDWDAPYPGLLGAPFSTTDPCVTKGNNIDPDQLDGKLDALDLSNPNPTPGNVVPKGDLCEVWRAVEYVDTNGAPRPVFYGAWRRPADVSGEITVFFPFVGPAPGKADDLLVAFEYDSRQGGSTIGSIWRWNGTTWRPTTQTTGFEAAVDNSAQPTFGEFALDLTAVGLFAPGTCDTTLVSYAFTRTGQENSNAELQDYGGMDPLTVSNCSRLEITKVTNPVADTDTSFGFTVGSVRGGAVDGDTGAVSINGTLTVPSADTFTSTTVAARDDLTLAESATPGWDLSEAACDAVDGDGTATHFDLVVGGVAGPDDRFTTFPGGVTKCELTNDRRGSITIVKVADPADGTDFPFTATGPGVTDFTLDVDNGDDPTFTDQQTFTDLEPGQTYSFTEDVPVGWDLLDISCAGADGPSISLPTATATIDLRVGEDVICTFSNGIPPTGNTDGTLIVVKIARPADGTDFPFTGSAGIGDFILDNDLPGDPDFTHNAYEVFTVPAGTSTVTEQVPAGWNLANITCSGSYVVTDATVDIDVSVDTVEVCVFVDLMPSSLTVVKRTEPAGGTGFPFTVQPLDASFTLADSDSRQFTDLGPNLYTIREAVPAGWTTTDITCTGATTGSVDLATGMAEVRLRAGQDALCTYTNTRTAAITITKVVAPAGASGPAAGFGFDTVGDGLADRFLHDGESFTLAGLLPGTYTVDELVPSGWAVDVVCSKSQRIDRDLNSGTASITVAAGETVSCTYTNTKLGQITVRKNSSPDATQDVDFSAVYGTAAPITFILDDDGNDVSDPDLSLLPDQATATGLRPGTYTIGETVPDGWTFSGVACTGATTSKVDIANGTVTIVLNGAESLDCTFTNVRSEAPAPTTTVLGNGGGTLPASGGGGLALWWPIAELLIGAGAIALIMGTLRTPRTSPARVRKDR